MIERWFFKLGSSHNGFITFYSRADWPAKEASGRRYQTLLQRSPEALATSWGTAAFRELSP